MINSVGIIGYGRFGKVLAKLLADEFTVKVYDSNVSSIDDSVNDAIELVSEEQILTEPFLFIAVPINQFEHLIRSIAPRLPSNTTVFDTCSIKLHPVQVMETYLPKAIGIIATHPLFGPDSINASNTLNVMMHPVRDTQSCYNDWTNYFSQKQFNVVEITPDEHDRLAAESQGAIHFVARFLKAANLQSTPIDTLGFKQLLKLIECNCNDSWELFSDLQRYSCTQ